MTHITILDGGMSRELQAVGAPFRQPEWSALALIEAPEYVSQVHRAYAESGANVITTNAYALVPFHIGPERFADDGEGLATLAATLAREVGDAHGVTVAGDLPPALGSYRPDLFDRDAAYDIVSVLVDAQAPFVDVWLSETLSSTAEARVVADVLSDRNNTLPWWVSFTLADVLEGQGSDARAALRSGESVGDAVNTALELGASFVAFNCSPPEVMEAAVREARAINSEVGIGVYANAFDLGSDSHHQKAGANESLHEIRGDLDAVTYTDFAQRWIAAGATAVGGCCGIDSDQIRELASRFGAASS